MQDGAAPEPADHLVAGRPREGTTVPLAVEALAGGRPLRAVWKNELGGISFEMGSGATRSFVKWAPAGSGIDLAREATRLVWAADLTPVPRVLDQGTDDTGSWLVTAGLAGESAVTDRWKADPVRAVDAIGRGLRALHEALPVDSCPFSWSVEDRLADALRRTAAGQLDSTRWHAIHQPIGVERALDLLADAPPPDKLVVCHGDACAPNTLLHSDGIWSGHVDLGALGIADRWADLAIATWSTNWNYGPGWEERLLTAYGIAPDDDRTRYYRLLWDLGP
jgi:kanamycin kinase